MQGRLNPTVLDLLVAIAAGVAGAYTKSFKEILQSLAGVAIAVALVPPLAVAGIGLGRLDPSFFRARVSAFSHQPYRHRPGGHFYLPDARVLAGGKG